MTWTKALTLSHDASVSSWWNNIVTPYFTWMGTQPGISTTIGNWSGTTGIAGIKYTSTRFGNTYNHGYCYYYNNAGNGTMATYYWEPADQATNTPNTSGQLKRNDTYFQRPSTVEDLEVWQSDEHKSWILFSRVPGSQYSYIRGAFMDPDDLTQGAEIGGKDGYRETLVIGDSLYCLGNVDSTTNAFTNQGWLQSIWDRKSSEVLVKNWYALFSSTYDFDTNSSWMYSSVMDIGYTYMANHNDMHCSGASNTLSTVVQLQGDTNYYINTGGGGGMFLNCGTTAPDFFGYTP